MRRLTAAIVVNDRLAQAASQGKAAQSGSRARPMKLRNLTALAQAAVGFDAGARRHADGRGSGLRPESLGAAGPAAEQVLSTAENSPVLVKYAALVGRPAGGAGLRRASGAAPRRVGADGADGKQSGAARNWRRDRRLPRRLRSSLREPAEADPERIRTQEIFEQVTAHLKREPTQSSRLLQSWIHSD